ncbi:MAG: hypothetical protein QOE36_229 [Gaiellaceae bacterium]|nr:hypothetical protein [Gaiellaceae bacterium]
MTPYTEEERATIAAELVELLRGDEDVAAVELIGSLATGTADAFSDVDIAVRVERVDAIATVADRWTARVHERLAVVAHFAVEFPPDQVRGFLLENLLEIDLGFSSEARATEIPPSEPRFDFHTGVGWHDVVHAAAALARGRRWRAHMYIAGIRDRTLTMAAERHGLIADEFKGIDDLPAEELGPLEATLAASLEPAELRRVLLVVTRAFIDEVRRGDEEAAKRLEPALLECLRFTER